MRFAGFVMTFERPEIVLKTIESLLSQSFPPEKILVIDNSESNRTELAIRQFNHPRVFYHKVGYNAGPAGAAKIGLELLSSDGYDWIYWGDDDDPPTDSAIFERLLSLAQSAPNAGAVASAGGKFNRLTGRTRNLANRELHDGCEVDFIPGGRNFIINAAAVKQSVLPAEELFFGFEELDYCLKLKKNGYRLYVDGGRWLAGRVSKGNTDPNYRWKGRAFGKKLSVRNYYSARNILFILWWNRLYVALAFNILKIVGKTLIAFRFGFKYGITLARINATAIYHFITGRKFRCTMSL